MESIDGHAVLRNAIAFRDRTDNPVVFLQFGTAEKSLGRVVLELRADICPVAAENFRVLCTGEKGRTEKGVNLHYKNTKMHRVVRDTLAQGGDLMNRQGEYSLSVYGGYFADENFIFRHTGPGVLSMVNRGPDTNGSQFMLSFIEVECDNNFAPKNGELDDRYVAFGCAVNEASLEVIQVLNSFATPHGEPREEIWITDCGQLFP